MKDLLMQKKVLVLAGCAVLGITFVSFALAGTRQEQTTTQNLGASITTIVTPTNKTNIRINGQNVKEGITPVKPGSYEVVVSHAGFATETRKVILKQNQSAQVAVALRSNSDETSNYYGENQSEDRKRERISGLQSQAVIKNQIEQSPIVGKLPKIVPNHYRIDFGPSVQHPNDSDRTAIYVTYISERDKRSAQDWFTYNGYNPDSLEIIYKTTNVVTN